MKKFGIPLVTTFSIILFMTTTQIGFAEAETAVTVNKVLLPHPGTGEQGLLTEDDFDLFVGLDTISGIQVINGIPTPIIPGTYSVYENRKFVDIGEFFVNRELINYMVSTNGECTEDTHTTNQLLARQNFGVALSFIFQIHVAEAEIKALQGQIDDLQSQIDAGGNAGVLQAQIDVILNKITQNMEQIVIKKQQAATSLGTAQSLLQTVRAVLSLDPDEKKSCNIINTYDPIIRSDLSITKSAPSMVMPGEELTSIITVTNHGPGDDFLVWVDDYLPLGTSLVSVTPSDGTCNEQLVGNLGQPGFRCEIDSIPKDSSITITVILSISPDALLGTTVTNTVAIAGINLVDENDFAMSTTAVGSKTNQIVGGKSIPIETIPLILAALHSTTWLIPFVLAVVGIGLVFLRK